MTDDFEQAHSQFSGLSNALSVLGFRTVTDLLNDRPGIGYLKVSDELEQVVGYADVSLSAAALQNRHLREALASHEFRKALADSFVRCVQDDGRTRRAGWGSTPSPVDQMSILSGWAAIAEFVAEHLGYDITKQINAASDLIRNAPPPKGWIPKSGDDPIIKNAIENAFRDSPLN